MKKIKEFFSRIDWKNHWKNYWKIDWKLILLYFIGTLIVLDIAYNIGTWEGIGSAAEIITNIVYLYILFKIKEMYQAHIHGLKIMVQLQLKPFISIGDLMTMKRFLKMCRKGTLLDEDGVGICSFEYGMSEMAIIPSDVTDETITIDKLKKVYSHVLWINSHAEGVDIEKFKI